MISKLFEKILLLEKKDHLIKKLNLTDSQKQQLITHFAKFPHLESKIDWNNKNLSWKEFEPLLKSESKTQIRKKRKTEFMGGMTPKKDYIILDNSNGWFQSCVLTHRQAVYFGSKYFLGHEGEWCISTEKDATQWKQYKREKAFFIILKTPKDDKYMLRLIIRENNLKLRYSIWDSNDSEMPSSFVQEHYPNIHKYIKNNILSKEKELIEIEEKSFFRPRGVCIIGKDISIEELDNEWVDLSKAAEIRFLPGLVANNRLFEKVWINKLVLPKGTREINTNWFREQGIGILDLSETNIKYLSQSSFGFNQSSQNRDPILLIKKVILPKQGPVFVEYIPSEFINGYVESTNETYWSGYHDQNKKEFSDFDGS